MVLKLRLNLVRLVAIQLRFDGLYLPWNSFRLSHPPRQNKHLILVVQVQAVEGVASQQPTYKTSKDCDEKLAFCELFYALNERIKKLQ